MPKAFLLKRNFNVVDTLGLTTPYIARKVFVRSALDGNAGGFHQRERTGGKSKVFGFFTEEEDLHRNYTYTADVCDGLNYAAKRLAPENHFINNKKNPSGGKATASNHPKEAKPKAVHGKKSRKNADSDDEEWNDSLSLSNDEEEEATQMRKISNGINKSNKNKLHNSRKDKSEKAIHRCEQCGKIFKTKYTLSIHLKMPDHTESRPFVCNICGKGFRLSSTLCRHKIIHTQKKPHKCEICNKSFNRSSTLKTHVRTHSEKKAFMCDICGKGFHQKGNLRNHIMIHTGEKPFQCSQCHRAFNKMSNLKFHMHTHTDNLPYQCKTCRKRFIKKIELRQHNEEVHDGHDEE